MATTKRSKIKAKIQKKARPTFRRSESWRLPGLRTSWRRSHGVETKMRIYHQGNKGGWGTKSPSPGYETDRSIRGLHPSGYKNVTIHTESDIDKLKLRPKHHAITIGSSVGGRKRVQLKRAITERGFKLLNPGLQQERMPTAAGLPSDVEGLGKIEKPEITAADLEGVDVEDVDTEPKEDEEQ
jgi:large subunit ribosomal protein L32e